MNDFFDTENKTPDPDVGTRAAGDGGADAVGGAPYTENGAAPSQAGGAADGGQAPAGQSDGRPFGQSAGQPNRQPAGTPGAARDGSCPPGSNYPQNGGARRGGYNAPGGNYPPNGSYPPNGNYPPNGGAYPPGYYPPNPNMYPPGGNAPWYGARSAEKPRLRLTSGDKILAPVMLALSILTVAIGVFEEMRLGFSIGFALLFLCASAYLAGGEKRRHAGPFGYVCGALGLASGGVYAICSNVLVRLCAFPLMIVLSVIWLYSLSGRQTDGGDLGLVSSVWRYGIAKPLGGIPAALAALVAGNGKKDRKTGKILIGLLCAVPVLCVLIPLLSHADAAFEGLLENFTDHFGERLAQVVIGLVLTPFLLSFCYNLKRRPAAPPRERQLGKVDGAFSGAFLAVIAGIYLIYLFSQLAYFTNAFKGFLPADFSYAEYARRGFFELCLIALINLALIFLTLILTRRNNDRLPAFVTAACVFIALFTLLLVCVDIAKMCMYIGEYGMTAPRLMSSAFMVFIAIVFFAVMLRMFRPRVKVLHTAVVTAGVIVLALGFVNVNRVAARYNYEAYMDGRLKEIDVNALGYDFDDEGIPYLELLAKNAEEESVRLQAADVLYSCGDRYYEDWWRSMDEDCSTDRTYSFFESNLPILQAYRIYEQYFTDTFPMKYAFTEQFRRGGRTAEEPTTEPVTAEEPTTEVPTTQAPVTEAPTEAATQAPAAQAPATTQPAAETPAGGTTGPAATPETTVPATQPSGAPSVSMAPTPTSPV